MGGNSDSSLHGSRDSCSQPESLISVKNASSCSMANIVVLGAGVSGLTTALQLARSDNNYHITVVAKHMPGDYDIEYASPWAGADFEPNLAAKQAAECNDTADTTNSSLSSEFERSTWPELERLARDLPEAGIHFQESRSLLRAEEVGTGAEKWLDDLIEDNLLPDLKIMPKSQLPPGYERGASFTSVCINTALYLPWLASQCLKFGIIISRGFVAHIADAAKLHHTGKQADLVVNCTGLSSLHLGGVEDTTLYPVRGQIVIVRNNAPVIYSTSGTDDGHEEAAYIMMRAAGGGTVLGGSVQSHVWESQPDLNLAVRIMQRCVKLCPELVSDGAGIEDLSIVRHAVGLRPMRSGGIRVEKEVIQGVPVVHNYGHGGCGYQMSYGAAEAARKMVEETL